MYVNKHVLLFISLFLALLGLCCCVQTSPAAVNRACGARAAHCSGFSCRGAGAVRAQAQSLWHVGLVATRHGGEACGIIPDQGSNSRPLHWQEDSQPLDHQGSPGFILVTEFHAATQDNQ